MKKSKSTQFKLPALQSLQNKYNSVKPVSNTFSCVENKWKVTRTGGSFIKQISIHSALKSRKPDLIKNLRRSLKNPYAYQPGHIEIPFSLLEEKYTRLANQLCNF